MLKVTTHFTGFPGGPYINVMHFDGTDQTHADAAALAVRTFWDGVKGTICGPGLIFVDEAVFTIDIGTGEPTGVFFTSTTSVTPGLSSDPLPAGTQGVILLRTGIFVDGYEVRGRVYVPRPTEGHNGTGTPDSTYRGILDTAMATLEGTSGVDLQVWSKTHGLSAPTVSSKCSGNWARLLSRR